MRVDDVIMIRRNEHTQSCDHVYYLGRMVVASVHCDYDKGEHYLDFFRELLASPAAEVINRLALLGEADFVERLFCMEALKNG